MLETIFVVETNRGTAVDEPFDVYLDAEQAALRLAEEMCQPLRVVRYQGGSEVVTTFNPGDAAIVRVNYPSYGL